MKRLAVEQARAAMRDGWPAALASSGVLLTLLVPSALLDVMGLGYSTPTGAAWEKVHPGSDLVLLAFVIGMLRTGAPIAYVFEEVRRFPGAFVFLVTITFLTLYIIVVQHAPFTPLIDTFFVPVLAFLIVVDFDERWRSRAEVGLHLFVAVNAALGIVEYVSGWRLIPVVLDGVSQTAEIESRAFGLLGHPLASAAMAGLYAVIMAFGGGRRLPETWRLPAIGLQLAALAAFGGRTALVLAVLCLAGAGLARIFRVLGGQRIDVRGLGLLFLLSPLAVGFVAVLANAGFFDVILERFVNDNGSAKARQIIFDLFSYMSWQDLLLGPDQDRLATLQHLLGIEVGIESFWFGFLFAYGLLPSLVFFAGLACFTIHIMAKTDVWAWIPLFYFVGIISTANSLAAKSTSLGQFIVTLVVFMPALRQTVSAPMRSFHPIPAAS